METNGEKRVRHDSPSCGSTEGHRDGCFPRVTQMEPP